MPARIIQVPVHLSNIRSCLCNEQSKEELSGLQAAQAPLVNVGLYRERQTQSNQRGKDESVSSRAIQIGESQPTRTTGGVSRDAAAMMITPESSTDKATETDFFLGHRLGALSLTPGDTYAGHVDCIYAYLPTY